MADADYIVVGSGSAGSALAYRLSEQFHNRVIVVEYGGSDAGPLIQMPAALAYPMNMPRYDWGYRTEPEPHLGGRQLACPRGKVIGGSSSINGMVYVRGHARDFDHWAESGCRWLELMPTFCPILSGWRRWHDGGRWKAIHPGAVPMGLYTSRAGLGINPLFRRLRRGRTAGRASRLTDDYNGEKQEGFGPMEQTVWQGRRWSAANAYLRPALKRPNVRLARGLARRVVIEEGRAVGIEIERGGVVQTLRAAGEVILAASSINSPKLLLLSGIGPADELRGHGIRIEADRPGVGRNLQDHLELYIQQACSQPISLYKHWNLAGKAMIGAQWLFTRTGLGATNHFESAAFIRSRAGIDYPDIQYHFLPIAVRYDGQAAADGHGFQAHVGPMRSASRGWVRLRSADPAAAPKICFNYMSTAQDWHDFRTCIRLTREIFAQPAFDEFRGREIQPGGTVQSDEALDDFIRQHVESAYHPCGTCRMGAAADPHAVVDPECRVIGVRQLRVIDSSIFPRITNGNLNGPSIMTGEKGADHVLGRQPLARANDEPWIHPDWQTAQR